MPTTIQSIQDSKDAQAGSSKPAAVRRVQPGQRFGRWVTESDAGGTGAMSYRWNCLCDCGSRRSVLEYSLLYNASLSCGCLNTEKVFEKRMATARERFIGKRFGWLTVTDVLPAEGSRRGFRFVASCSCGNKDPKSGRLADLATGKVSSCCGPAPYTDASQQLLLDVLEQLEAGAPHYPDDHRILKVLAERGAYDAETRQVTDLGARSLASGVLQGYRDDLQARRSRRTEQEKVALVAKTFEPGRTVSEVARAAGVAESLLSRWRKKMRDMGWKPPSSFASSEGNAN